MSNTYTRRTTFEIARNDDSPILCFASVINYRIDEYIVAHAKLERFANVGDALARFEELTKESKHAPA